MSQTREIPETPNNKENAKLFDAFKDVMDYLDDKDCTVQNKAFVKRAWHNATCAIADIDEKVMDGPDMGGEMLELEDGIIMKVPGVGKGTARFITDFFKSGGEKAVDSQIAMWEN